MSVLQQYVIDLISAGKSQDEVTEEIEQYYASLTSKCDQDILMLQDQIEMEKGRYREEAANEVCTKANELDHLSDLFIECVHAQRKSLRQKLVRMRSNN
jgi:hypothetical protein